MAVPGVQSGSKRGASDTKEILPNTVASDARFSASDTKHGALSDHRRLAAAHAARILATRGGEDAP
jgi:hypothetical protein